LKIKNEIKISFLEKMRTNKKILSKMNKKIFLIMTLKK